MQIIMILKIVGISFLFLLAVVFFIKWFYFSTTEGEVNRLSEEIEKTKTQQAELLEKMRKADEELNKRKAEARELTDKMRTEAEEESKSERDKIISKSREEAEEIIAKAQAATETLKVELEKEMDTRAVKFSMELLNRVLNDKAQGTLDKLFIEEFIDKLDSLDMSRIGDDVKSAELITLSKMDSDLRAKLSKVIKGKIGREIELKETNDPNMGGGVCIKFGSMALDGSVANSIREAGIALQEEIDSKK